MEVVNAQHIGNANKVPNHRCWINTTWGAFHQHMQSVLKQADRSEEHYNGEKKCADRVSNSILRLIPHDSSCNHHSNALHKVPKDVDERGTNIDVVFNHLNRASLRYKRVSHVYLLVSVLIFVVVVMFMVMVMVMIMVMAMVIVIVIVTVGIVVRVAVDPSWAPFTGFVRMLLSMRVSVAMTMAMTLVQGKS